MGDYNFDYVYHEYWRLAWTQTSETSQNWGCSINTLLTAKFIPHHSSKFVIKANWIYIPTHSSDEFYPTFHTHQCQLTNSGHWRPNLFIWSFPSQSFQSLDTCENPRLHEIEAFPEKHGFNLILAKNKFENCYDAVFHRILN